jgi:2-keto-3-deoxy-L-rhamnonate aldolase RhmA
MAIINSLHNLDNPIIKNILGGGVSIGVFLLSGNTFIAEAMAHFPIEWMLIDMEASHTTNEQLLHILQALNAYDVVPLVRIAEQNKHLVEHSLDLGAKGVMIPKVDNGQQAEEITAACYYPPKGNRGVNCIRASGYYTRARQYFNKANDCILSIAQIESKESLINLDDIANTQNVDILFIGLGDLAASYGQNGNVEGELMEAARRNVVTTAARFNKIPGIFAHSIEVAHKYIDEGFKFIAIGNDIKFLNQGLTESFRNL